MDGGRKRNQVLDFVKKAYEMVDDASTDSIVSWGPHGLSFIVWKPLECKRDLLTKHLEIYSFSRFKVYGFREIHPGEEPLEFACNGFVRGKPELLVKIAEDHVAFLQPHLDRFKRTGERLRNCKTKEERELVKKELVQMRKKEIRDKVEEVKLAMAIDRLRAKRLADQMQHVHI